MPNAVVAITSHLADQPYEFEIIVVDDGSTDKTASVAQNLAKTCPQLRLLKLEKNSGKGAAVKTGVLASLGEFVLFTDADQSTPIHQLDKLMYFLTNQGFDIAIGSRGKKGAEILRSQTWYRQSAGKLFGLMGRVLLYRGIVDSQCGFKVMTKNAAKKIFGQLSSPTAIFDMELLVLSSKFEFAVAEVPVEWIHDPDTRLGYNLNRSLCVVWELLRIKFRHRIWLSVKIQTQPPLGKSASS